MSAKPERNTGNEPLMNKLARKVGRAAGLLTNATQGLAANAAASVGSGSAGPAPARKKRSTTKRKTGKAKSTARPARKRTPKKH